MQSENNKHIAFYGDKRQKRDDGRGGEGGSTERCNATSRGANNGFILSATLVGHRDYLEADSLGFEDRPPGLTQVVSGKGGGSFDHEVDKDSTYELHPLTYLITTILSTCELHLLQIYL